MDFANYAEYLWYLLHRPFKLKDQDNSQVNKFLTATGPVMDQAKQDVFSIRQQAMIATASGKALDKHGKDRQMPRYEGEEDDPYRERLLAKFDIARMGGTVKGIKRALTALGYNNADIELMKVYDADRWAEFIIWIDKVKLNELNNMNIVEKEVARIKQASSLPNYGFLYPTELRIMTDWIKGSCTYRICNTFKCNQINQVSEGLSFTTILQIETKLESWEKEYMRCNSFVCGEGSIL